MRQRTIVVTVAAVGLFFLYQWILVYTIGYAVAVPIPTWWRGAFPNRGSGAMSWVMLWHTAAVLAVAVPFAWVIARYFSAHAVLLALAVTLASILYRESPLMFQYFSAMPTPIKVVTVLDYIVVICSLPMVVWLLKRLPSNNRIERTREA